jgi:hypothetical protein
MGMSIAMLSTINVLFCGCREVARQENVQRLGLNGDLAKAIELSREKDSGEVSRIKDFSEVFRILEKLVESTDAEARKYFPNSGGRAIAKVFCSPSDGEVYVVGLLEEWSTSVPGTSEARCLLFDRSGNVVDWVLCSGNSRDVSFHLEWQNESSSDRTSEILIHALKEPLPFSDFPEITVDHHSETTHHKLKGNLGHEDSDWIGVVRITLRRGQMNFEVKS